MTGRRVLEGLGLVLALAGLAMFFVPSLAAAVPLNEPGIWFVAAAIAVYGLYALNDRYTSEVTVAETDDPESAIELTSPGDDFDARLAEIARGHRASANRDAVRERLESAAVETIARHYGCSRDRAIELLDTGEWTDDPLAAVFFTRRFGTLDLETRARLRLSRRGRFVRTAEAAARAVHRLGRRSA